MITDYLLGKPSKEQIASPEVNRHFSPELLQGLEVTQKNDVWSFGVFLYEFIFGVEPWDTAKTREDMVTFL